MLLNLRREAGLFDPLDSLREFLGEVRGEDLSSTVLIPLCHSLGLPGGFVPARMLQETFLRLSAAPPDFEGGVKGVLAKLPAFDAGVLGEWCASKYLEAGRGGKLATMRLQCLEESYKYSLTARKELEQVILEGTRGGEEDFTMAFRSSDSEKVKQSQECMKMVRRIGLSLSALKNALRMREILDGSDDSCVIVNEVLRGTVDEILREKEGGRESGEEEGEEEGSGAGEGEGVKPEVLCERLLSEGARRAARAFERGVFKVEDLRDAAWRVHSAAGALAEVHTEVNVERTCRRLARALIEGGRGGGAVEKKKADILYAPTSSGGGMTAIGEDEEDEDDEEEGGEKAVDMSLDLKSLALTKAVDEEEEDGEREEQAGNNILKRERWGKDDVAAVQIAFLLSYSYSFFGGGGIDLDCW